MFISRRGSLRGIMNERSVSISRFRFGLLVLAICLVDGVSFVSSNGGNQKSQTSTAPSKPQRSVSTPKDETQNNSHPGSQPNNDVCPNGEAWCSLLDETEKLALEAITVLFRQLDDDKDGNIDLEESNEFLREELKYEKNVENRQKAFHRDDDTQVSVRELWDTWIKSEVHNWTVVQTLDWLKTFVGLPQHQERFSAYGVNGSVLPILAVNHNNFLTTAIGIKDSITKQKIVVKAMDVVLFGPPRDNTNYIKDIILTSLLAVAVIVCLEVYRRYKLSQEDLSKMTRHMAELSKAEEILQNLQQDIEKSKTDQERQGALVNDHFDGEGPEELVKLREENQVLRNELHRAEAELQDKCWVAPHSLQLWLQYTYELELKGYNKKKNSAERQLKQAKEACDKLKKKRSSLMGAFVSTHGRSIDDVDKAILEARTALTEITHELQERMHRWKQIELLIGCQIMNNGGLQNLDSALKIYGKPTSYSIGPGSVISNSQDDIDDDASSIYCPSTVHKLISTSTFLMFPGHQVSCPYPPATASRMFSHQQSPSDYSSVVNISSGHGGNNRSHEASVKENKVNGPSVHNSITSPNPSCESPSEMSTINENPVSAGAASSNMSASMARSRSTTSMSSLRDRTISREPSSQDSSNGDADVLSDPQDLNGARDRRVTFRADRRANYRILVERNGRNGGSSFESMDREESRRAVSRVLQNSNSVDSSLNLEEESEAQVPQISTPETGYRIIGPYLPRRVTSAPVTLPETPLLNETLTTQTVPQNQVPVKSPKNKVWNVITSFVRNNDKKVWPMELSNQNLENSVKKSKRASFKGLFQRPAKIHPISENAQEPLPDCIL